ncbi:MAG: nuclear transport factor 2 family protein [Proteobacteria bacterium]|nr:nuclear transport factor 2 family protein [Pseudomonadota bacterium]
MRSTTIILAAVLLNLSPGLLTSGCSKCETFDDETQIRKLIEDAAKSAEKRDIKELLELLTEDFVASPGAKDRQAIKGILFIAFRRYGKFTVEFPRPVVNVDPSLSYAEAATPFLIVRKGQDIPGLSDLYDDPKAWIDKIGNLADPYHLDIWFIKKGDEWLVRKAHLHSINRLEDI